MGKPFRKELDNLEETYAWACSTDVSRIVGALKSSWDTPTFVVGSGGSYSAAEFQANLHRSLFGSLALAVTPMELVHSIPANGDSSVWLLSASGNNIDIRRAFQHAALMEPKTVSCLVGKYNSKIKSLSEKYQYTNVFEYELPNGKDGFLATNSLFGFSAILYKAYCEALNRSTNLPSTLNEFIKSRLQGDVQIEKLISSAPEVWRKDVIHVVFSPQLKAVAIDIESKFVEAGLGSVHLADLRNFAHGRHHWFSKNSDNSSILSLSKPEDFELASKTLELLPASLPKLHITLCGENGSDSLVGLLVSFYLTNNRGQYRNIDPGRPGVPEYGSKIYRLTEKSGFKSSFPKLQAAINRKSRIGIAVNNNDSVWRDTYNRYTKILAKQEFGGIVLDYDGTVVDARHRGTPPNKDICDEINRLLDAGLAIGFATGRGKSIRKELQNNEVIKKENWEKVLIGYYNGSNIGKLGDDSLPNGADHCCEELEFVCELLMTNLYMRDARVKITRREQQITLEPQNLVPESFLWRLVKTQLESDSNNTVETLRSSHSVDVLAAGVTKLAVIKHLRSNLSADLEVLTIGDRGRWPGNDCDLLNRPYSLSVDEVSFSLERCWNLCPSGVRGPQGTLEYLKRISAKDGVAKFRI